jgi:hypothetical protein
MQRVSIIDRGDQLGIEIEHLASGNTTVIDVEYYM